MSLIFRNESSSFSLFIRHITESLPEMLSGFVFSVNEKTEFDCIKNDLRKQQWLTTRKIIRDFFNDNTVRIEHHPNGKPLLINAIYNISISHTFHYVAVMLSNTHQVAVDIEVMERNIERIARKFVNEQEWMFITENNKKEYLYVLWGAKESLFKLYSQGNLDFRTNLNVAPFLIEKKGKITAYIKKNDFVQEYSLYYEILQNLVMVYVSDKL